MITFTVKGTPIAQGSKVAWVPTKANRHIERAILELRSPFRGSASILAVKTADELEAIGNWPIYVPSKTGGNGRWLANMRESNDNKLRPWRKAITKAAAAAWPHNSPYDGPICVDVEFYFRRPKKHFRTGKFSQLLRDDAPKRHAVKPDADKLLRAILDGITGVVIVDDCRAYRAPPEKFWLPDREAEEHADVLITFPDEGDWHDLDRSRQ